MPGVLQPGPTNNQDMIHKRFLGSGIPYICLVLFYGISDSEHGLETLSSCYLTQKKVVHLLKKEALMDLMSQLKCS